MLPLLSVSLDFLLPALLGREEGPPPPCGDLGLARTGPPLRRYCSSTVCTEGQVRSGQVRIWYLTDLRNFLLWWDARRWRAVTVRSPSLAWLVMLYLWCKLSLTLRVEPVLHHGLLVYDPHLWRHQVCVVTLSGQTWPTAQALKWSILSKFVRLMTDQLTCIRCDRDR